MRRRATAALSLGALLGTTVVTLALGAFAKAPCAAGDWADGRQYKRLCYSDIVPLYGTEQLSSGRVPFLDRCVSGGGQCDEYPVLTMYLMRAGAAIVDGVRHVAGGFSAFAAFFWANAFLLSICALATTVALWRVVGERAVAFAAAPTLLVYGFMNWDLLAVALATLGTVAFLRRRDGWAGVLLGLGTAAKLYPALLLLPFGAARLRERRPRRAVGLAGAAAVAWLAVDLPFAVASPHAWSTFFRFNTLRPVDWDSLWFAACQRLQGDVGCSWSPRVVDAAAAVAFVVLLAAVWALRARRDPGFELWTLGFPVVTLFLLTNKVYSPQYGLWLLPWFALALPDLRLFLAFEATDVAVFVTRFTWFGRYAGDLGDRAFAGYAGTPLGGFELAVAIRAAVLVGCLAAWVWSGRPRAGSADGVASVLPIGAAA